MYSFTCGPFETFLVIDVALWKLRTGEQEEAKAQRGKQEGGTTLMPNMTSLNTVWNLEQENRVEASTNTSSERLRAKQG